MDTPDTDDDAGPLDRLFTKRTAIVVVVAGIIALGAGAGITSTFFDSGVQQVVAQDGPDGASASVSIADGSTASVSFAGTGVAEPTSGAGLRRLNVSVGRGGDLDLSGVSKVDETAVESPPTNRTAGYLSIDHAGDAEIDSVTFTFEVTESTLAQSGIDPGNVTLHRLDDGEWQPLETALQSSTNGVYTYQAVSPGLSVFAVGDTPTDADADAPDRDESGEDDAAEPTSTEPPETTEPPSEPEPSTATPEAEGATDTSDMDSETSADSNTGGDDDSSGSSGAPSGGSDSTDPVFTLSVATEPSIESVDDDRGDVDVVEGEVDGTATWSEPSATEIMITVSISDGTTTRELREANASVTNQTKVALEDVLEDTRLLYLTGVEAEAFSVAIDGETRTYERTVTVNVTLFRGAEELTTVRDTETLDFTVTNEAASGSGSGGSNAGAE
ncbi:PGF-pre-PGF domain-containing protein [Halobaculum lipolyticum]|uniref:PGF-pre-PGF domain-containing protein n=1 Tax=Halobaculum lipolyticum TaxID=3032001 RepID=A0ABD5WCP3_9EURY|nr:PGF-pre-PGF domain-containing protein [Halobaculum sp. DT31]